MHRGDGWWLVPDPKLFFKFSSVITASRHRSPKATMWGRPSSGRFEASTLSSVGILAVVALCVCVWSVPRLVVGGRSEMLSAAAMKHKAHQMDQWEDTYFQPNVAGGKPLTIKERTALFSDHKSAKGHGKVDEWENGYFQPLGKGVKLSETQRFKLLEQGHAKRAGASKKWQKWEDEQFGHSMDAVAQRRLPAKVPQVGGSKVDGVKKKQQSLVDALTSKSWVDNDEVDGGVHHGKVQRFVDSLGK